MATDDTQKLIIRKVLAETPTIEAFEAMLEQMIKATRDVTCKGGDFFTESAILMKRESRVQTLRDIMAEFRAMHNDAKSDNPYNLNQT